MPRPTTSVSMWPASESRASERVASPATTSTTMNTPRTPNAASRLPLWRAPAPPAWLWEWRSEEHTSELQSLMRNSYAVFCLKKNKTHTIIQREKERTDHITSDQLTDEHK